MLRAVDWTYDAWPTGEPYDWGGASRGDTVYDALDYHVDLGCGTVKKGRIGVDRFAAPGVNVIADLDKVITYGVPHEVGHDAVVSSDGPQNGLPFGDGEVQSIVTHHCFEHIGDGLPRLMDECYRVLKPEGILYVIAPLFPSTSALTDPDHKRLFLCNEQTSTFDYFCGHLGDENNPTGSWQDSFSVPYTKARFRMVHRDYTAPTPPERAFGPDDVREMRIALRAVK